MRDILANPKASQKGKAKGLRVEKAALRQQTLAPSTARLWGAYVVYERGEHPGNAIL